MLLRPKEVCERLGITYSTLRDYVKRGWIKPVILKSGKLRFREEDIDRLMGVVKPKITILYARVSPHDRKDDLDRQIRAAVSSFESERFKVESSNIKERVCGEGAHDAGI